MADDSVVHEREAAQEQEAPEPTGVDDDSLAILGLPRHAGAKDIEKLLATHAPGLAIRRVRLKPSVAIVKLESAEARDRALATLCGQKVVFKHYALKFDKAHTSEARLAKRKASEPGDGSEPKRPKTVEEAVTPLHAVGYEEQLALKAESIREVLGTLAKRLLKANAGGAWLSRQLTQRNGGRCCPQAEIVRAPATEGYRNKCEFTIGTGADGRPCVGFRLGQYRDGVTTVADPSGCAHVSAEMKRVVAAVQQVVRGSELPVVRSLGDGTVAGFWRQLLVRQNLRGELLISIMVNMPADEAAAGASAGGSAPSAARLEINKAAEAAAGAANVRCAYFQAFGGCSQPPAELPHAHLSGGLELVEELRGVRFRISPSAFFQVNTAAAEALGGVLERLVGEHGPAVTLLDVCCGAGAWGLCLASKVARVIGVELNAQAVQDARANAADNGIANAEFVCGKAEDVLERLLQRLGDVRLVAIVDPPRAGLHVSVLKALRGCRQLSHLIYVSCNPSSWVADSEKLCAHPSKAYRGDPFRPLRATPVDLFPHTAHCELVVQMARMPLSTPSGEAQPADAAPACAAAGGEPADAAPACAPAGGEPADAAPACAPAGGEPADAAPACAPAGDDGCASVVGGGSDVVGLGAGESS